jgi:hypothetical protein
VEDVLNVESNWNSRNTARVGLFYTNIEVEIELLSIMSYRSRSGIRCLKLSEKIFIYKNVVTSIKFHLTEETRMLSKASSMVDT